MFTLTINRIITSALATCISVASLATATVGAGLMVKSIDSATANQCANHLWPADAHDIHIEWCLDNGYSVK